jgi:hypothetical protein
MQNGHDTKESLSASLKQEQEEKEQVEYNLALSLN